MLPHIWDTEKNREEVWKAFENFHTCLKCGNTQQASGYFKRLAKLVKEAEERREKVHAATYATGDLLARPKTRICEDDEQSEVAS